MLPVNGEAAKAQEEEVQEAKEAALKASTAEDVFVPETVPDAVLEELVEAE